MKVVMRRSPGSSGGHGSSWVVSFADLMSLLMAFFVMLLSFSAQDAEKLKQAAGSVQDAFGIQPVKEMSGMIERLGNPRRDFLQNVSADPMKGATEFAAHDRAQSANQGQEANTWTRARTVIERQAQFGLAAQTLKQAFQDQPDITAIADHIFVQQTADGTEIEIGDRDGRAMFPPGSKYPLEMTRKALAAMAPLLQRLPNRVRISGYVAAGGRYDPHYGPWALSFDRANMARSILEESGLSGDRVESVVGRADADPFFPASPYMTANERISILLLDEKPPVPVDLKP
jgi:chemotaxis protein MotB